MKERPMSMRDFLLKESTEKEVARDHEMRKHVNDLCKEWREGYRKSVGEEYLISPKEKVQMRRMLDEYEKEKVQKTMSYYLSNFRELKKPDGYPSIPALYGFRRQLVLEATKGTIEKKTSFSGQYDASKMANDEWG